MPEGNTTRPSRSRTGAHSAAGPATTALQRARRRQRRTTEKLGGAASTPSPTAAGPTTVTSATAEQVSPAAARPKRRVRDVLLHPGRGQVIAAVILFVVGLGGVMQIRANDADDTYSSARREDLVQLLDGLTGESRRLESEITDLQRTKSELESGADSQRVAQQEAEKRIDALSILAGTAPAVGPGVRITVIDPQHKVTANVLLDAVEEMRDAGGEVIEFNNSVRVVASTSFSDTPQGVAADGVVLQSPFVIEVIGDSHSLSEAASFRGGLVSEIEGPDVGGQASVQAVDSVRIESLHTVDRNQYAQPASPATPR